MVVCCICGIEWVPEGVSFHKFPKSDNVRKRWLAAINKEIMNFTLSASSRICGQHFAVECFVITETGRRYLKSYAVPSVFNMPLKKKYILAQPVQIDECDVAITNEEQCSKIVDIDEIVEDNLEESYVSIVKNKNLAELDTVHSELLDISIINEKEMNEDQQEIYNEYKVIANTNHEELHSKITNVTEIKANLHKSHSSTTRRRRTTKYGTIHSGILDVSLFNKELIDSLRATEECNEILRKKLKTSQQKCRRLQRKVTFLALLIKHLQSKKLSQDNAKSLLEVNSEK